ncbi:MAG: leucine--tRNA ligase [Candidatus Eisenbacteria bacterium]|uniref:Leucine--tRNA ligase n=1 Tax=Eiseniibacteriota bacterium TaxID=2212470 RepID=A0A956SBS8_UNCEI|nr:leucine--tRNA ligase [Candidatus Eisenbacteria bacterium]
MNTYDFSAIEAKWQKHWEEHRTFRALGPGDDGFDPKKPKKYVLDMFPYPSGKGLHVGHPVGYIGTDIVSRYARMRGYNVLHPMGFDAFGLPAEQYAIETGTHPRVSTEANVANMLRQLKACALSYDWDREVRTIDPEYYKWTQWIFLQLFHSWFDPSVEKARPIAELVARLEKDDVRLDGGEVVSKSDDRFASLRAWSEFSTAEHHAALGRFRLAYIDDVPVNWCPALGTVLANEEVTNEGRSERGNHPVYRRPLKQWMLRITAYAERLLQDLNDVDWSEALKLMQRNWIGRSEGARVRFPVVGADREVEVYTTRPDTLFGATYMVLAPEHPWVDELTSADRKADVDAYRKTAAHRSELDRQADTKEKTGVFTGGYATNPVNGKQIPIWIADYVLMGYGTGAIMAVPCHDTRDFEFAQKFGLPIVPVVVPTDEWLLEQVATGAAPEGVGSSAGAGGGAGAGPDALRAAYLESPTSFQVAFTGHGKGIHSKNDEVSLDGKETPEAKRTIVAWLEGKGIGRGEVQFKLRDWLFSRQRFWGEPFPILHGPDGEIRAVDERDLPVVLPEIEDYKPIPNDDPEQPPQPSLSRAKDSWKFVELDGKKYVRELNTMPQWAGSCWYYLRYLDPRNDDVFVSPEAEQYWMSPNGVDLYVGGAEHAVLHLLYARFWHKVLFDLGHVSTKEPFGRLYNQGYIQAYSYQDARGIYVDAEKIEEKDGKFFYEGEPVTRSLGKMGKSLKNSVTPDDVMEQYGCDTFRLYEMYLGPLDQSKTWNTQAIVGIQRFLQRLWRNFVDEESGALRVVDETPDEEMLKLLHKTIHGATDDMDGFRFNTTIAKLIELNNAWVGRPSLPRVVADAMVRMLAPLAPHVAEELWQRLGNESSVSRADWPVAEEQYLVDDEIEIVVQVLGKKRGTVRVAAGASQEEIQSAAMEVDTVKPHLEGKTVRKVIYVPGKLLNIVAN